MSHLPSFLLETVIKANLSEPIGMFLKQLYFINTINTTDYKSILIEVFMSALNFNPVQDGAFWGCSRMGGNKAPLPKTCHTYTHILK